MPCTVHLVIGVTETDLLFTDCDSHDHRHLPYDRFLTGATGSDYLGIGTPRVPRRKETPLSRWCLRTKPGGSNNTLDARLSSRPNLEDTDSQSLLIRSGRSLRDVVTSEVDHGTV